MDRHLVLKCTRRVVEEVKCKVGGVPYVKSAIAPPTKKEGAVGCVAAAVTAKEGAKVDGEWAAGLCQHALAHLPHCPRRGVRRVDRGEALPGVANRRVNGSIVRAGRRRRNAGLVVNRTACVGVMHVANETEINLVLHQEWLNGAEVCVVAAARL